MSTGKTKVKVGLRNIAGTDINPATDEKIDSLITAIGNIKIDTGDIDLNTDGLEGLATDIKANQTNGTQTTKLKNVAGTTINPATEDNQTNGTQKTQIVDANGISVDSFTADAGYNGLISGNGILTVPFTTTTVQAVGTTNVSNFKGVSVQITSQGGSSTVTFQGSNDNTNWVSIALTISTSVTTAPVVSTTAASSYYGPLHFKHFRLNVTGIASGTTAGVIVFHSIYSHTNPITSTAVTLAAAATNVAKAEDSAAASANVGIPPLAVRLDTLVANAGVSADGDYAFFFCDNLGKLYVNAGQRDVATNSLMGITVSHQKVHAGDHFMYTDSVTLASAGTQDYLITTPNTTRWSHMTFYLDGSAITQWQLYESADRTGTTLQTVGNNNRNSATTATTTIHKGTSGGTTDGNLAYAYKGGSATNQSRTGTDAGNNEEIILKQNTKYILRVTSGTADNLTNIRLEWYEHTNLTA